ncbi:MAG: Gx transporter family protein [Firmicutes bacterium]|nr:Gx transporter family protein [Bacillota bacterium]
MNTKRIALLGIFVTYALVLNLVESWLPPLLVFAPGTRMGLSNIISLITLIKLGVRDSYIVLVIRCILTVMFTGNPFSIVYSLSGGLVSLTVMVLLYKFLFPNISIVAISIVGAFVHNITQVWIYSIIAETGLLMLLMLNFILASIVAGIVVGFVVLLLLRNLPPSLFADYRQKIEGKQPPSKKSNPDNKTLAQLVYA